MAKSKVVEAPAALPPPVVYPRSLLAVYSQHGTTEQFLATGEVPGDLAWVDDPTVKVARYVLVGTGVIEHSAPTYMEHTAT